MKNNTVLLALSLASLLASPFRADAQSTYTTTNGTVNLVAGLTNLTSVTAINTANRAVGISYITDSSWSTGIDSIGSAPGNAPNNGTLAGSFGGGTFFGSNNGIILIGVIAPAWGSWTIKLLLSDDTYSSPFSFSSNNLVRNPAVSTEPVSMFFVNNSVTGISEDVGALPTTYQELNIAAFDTNNIGFKGIELSNMGSRYPDISYIGVTGFSQALSGNYWAPEVGGGGNGTWASGSDVWATSGGMQGTNAQSTTDTLIFGDTAGTVTVSGVVSAQAGMHFTTNGYTVTGGTSITLAGANAASNTITTDAHVGATIDSVLAGTNGMTKAGAGTLTLGGANTYSGATEVNAGTLVVDGSANNSSVSVNNGGTLSGSGSVSGIVINSGGTISPGSSGPGELSASGNVEWLGGGNYNWQIYDTTLPAGTGWDLVSTTGTVDLSALTVGSEFNINLWSLSGVSPAASGPAVNFDPNQNYTWTILTAAGGITGYAGTNQFNINLGAFNGTDGFANALAPGWGFSVVKDGNNLNLIYAQQVGPQPVPEPGTWAAAVLLAGGAAFMRWRKRRTKVS